MGEVDKELEKRMRELPRSQHAKDKRSTGTKVPRYHRGVNEPGFDLKSELYRIAGVDLTDVPGIDTMTPYHPDGNRNGYLPVSERFRIRIVVRSLPGKCRQRRESSSHRYSTRKKQGYECTSSRSAVSL
jgi:hypothetical protein